MKDKYQLMLRSKRRQMGFVCAISVCFFVSFCKAQPAQTKKVFQSKAHAFTLEILFENKDVLWGFDFLPDNKVILTERKGSFLLLDLKTKKLLALDGAPEVAHEGQGGLLDVRVHPNMKKNPSVYYTYAEPSETGATTALSMAIWNGKDLQGTKKLFSAKALGKTEIHFGSRIEFDQKGHIFLSVGDRGDRDLAQRLDVDNGKILRLNEDGSIPKDNPFVKNKNTRPGVWSFGHRNPQGLSRHPETGELWEAEFGPRGGDEINLIEAANNYGWPVITYGREYHGPKIGQTHKEGMQQPIVHYTPSISPSGINFYHGKAFPKWNGNLFIGTLSGQHLRRVVLKDREFVEQEVLLSELHWRIRNVRQGPEGYLYVSTDEGRFARLIPIE